MKHVCKVLLAKSITINISKNKKTKIIENKLEIKNNFEKGETKS
jgi:hypothetical protein